MKTKFICKALLAFSFLFLVPNLCFSKGLEGVWKLVSSGNTSQIVKYKVFDKEGNFYNLDAYIKNNRMIDGLTEKISKKITVQRPYKVTRSGTYQIISKGVYSENMKYHNGTPTREVQTPISYYIKGKRMILLIMLGNTVYQEVYKKVPSLDVVVY